MQAKFHKNYIIKIHLSLLVSALILLYWQSFAYWIHTWVNNFDYMFGFIMPLLSFYIIWKRRDLFEFVPVKPSKSGLLIIIVGILLYVGGQAAYINVAQQVSFFIIIPGIILHYFGFHMLRLLSIPLMILVFMVPLPDFCYSYLQSFFTWASVEILRVFNVPVYAEGYSIQLPNVSVWVASGCTGIRSMTAILPIGLTIAHLYFDSRWNKVSMVIFSAILPILANIFRIVSLLIFALKGNPIFTYGTPHKIHGYVVFIGSLFILFGFASFLKRFRTKPLSKQKEMITSQHPLSQFWTQGFSSYGNLILVVLMVLIPALVHARLQTQSVIPLVQSFKSFPLVLGEWKGCELVEHEWRPEIIGATDSLYRLYKDVDENEIKIFVSYLPIQTQGQELVFHANKIIPPKFVIISQHMKIWNINANSSPFKLKTTFLQLNNGIQNKTLLYWYQNTNHYLHNKYLAKAVMTWDSLLQNRSNGSVFVLMFKSPRHNSNDYEIKLQNFLNDFMYEIRKYLPS